MINLPSWPECPIPGPSAKHLEIWNVCSGLIISVYLHSYRNVLEMYFKYITFTTLQVFNPCPFVKSLLPVHSFKLVYFSIDENLDSSLFHVLTILPSEGVS